MAVIGLNRGSGPFTRFQTVQEAAGAWGHSFQPGARIFRNMPSETKEKISHLLFFWPSYSTWSVRPRARFSSRGRTIISMWAPGW